MKSPYKPLWRRSLAPITAPDLKPMTRRQLRRQLALVKRLQRHVTDWQRAGWNDSIRFWQNEIAATLRASD